MKIKFTKLNPDAIVPTFGRPGDCGADLVATSITETDDYIEYGTGIAIELPPGTAGLVYPRSSLSKYDLSLCNHVGVIDVNFRGEIKLRFKIVPQKKLTTNWDRSLSYGRLKIYGVGDKIGQLIVHEIPVVEYEEVEELSDSVRGSNGFGSSGV